MVHIQLVPEVPAKCMEDGGFSGCLLFRLMLFALPCCSGFSGYCMSQPWLVGGQ